MRIASLLWGACVVALGVFWVRQPVSAADRRVSQGGLVIMTMNGNWLWDGLPPEEGQISFPWKGDPGLAQQHMAEVSDIIRTCNPDLLLLQEVENLQALTRFNTMFLADMGYKPYLINGTDTRTGQDVGLLTRVDPDPPFLQREERPGRSGSVLNTVSRNLWALFTVDDTRFALIGVHLDGDPIHPASVPQREAQADAIRTLGIELTAAGYPLVILGNFNDYDGSRESRDIRGNPPATQVLESIRRLNPATFDDDLVNAAADVPQELRYTRGFGSIDHILLSSELWRKTRVVIIPHDIQMALTTGHYPVLLALRTGDGTPPAPPGPIRMISLVPFPFGDERLNEEVVLRNVSAEPVSLAGWLLRDPAGGVWLLDAERTLEPGEERTVRRNGRAMDLGNTGDTIELVDPFGRVVQRVTYGTVRRGQRILAP